jgi:hypothetical protein
MTTSTSLLGFESRPAQLPNSRLLASNCGLRPSAPKMKCAAVTLNLGPAVMVPHPHPCCTVTTRLICKGPLARKPVRPVITGKGAKQAGLWPQPPAPTPPWAVGKEEAGAAGTFCLGEAAALESILATASLAPDLVLFLTLPFVVPAFLVTWSTQSSLKLSMWSLCWFPENARNACRLQPVEHFFAYSLNTLCS